LPDSSNIVYLNGSYLPVEEATISVMDRGFLFGDGVYEVIPVFGKNMLRLDAHMHRLQNSLNRISLTNPCQDSEWRHIFDGLLDINPGEDRAIYLQISRGVYARRDLGTDDADTTVHSPTVFAMVLHVKPPNIDVGSAGISAITVEDFRWDACDIKSTSLVANVILRHQASEANVDDAILIKNAVVTEGTASNVFIVKDDVIITPPTGKQLLSGITRDLVIEIAENNSILLEQRLIKESELLEADEIWMTSSTREIAPVIKLNGKAVGDGVAGKTWKRIMDLYQQYKQVLRQ
jgi:D-alanine transaminase